MSGNKEPKQDLRVTRTHKSLVAALFLLLETRSFQKVTVNEICESAMVSRATFYMHFEDKYHLLRYALEEGRRSIAAQCDCRDPEAMIRGLLDYTMDHAKVFRNLLLEDTGHELLRMFDAAFVEQFTAELERMEGEGKKFLLPVKMIAVFLAGGLSNLMIWWINGGFSQTKDEMVGYLTSFASREKELNGFHPLRLAP